MVKKCICQICTCGRHRCPHHPHTVPAEACGPCLLTEYRTSYVDQPFAAREPFKPNQEAHISNGPISDLTTHKVDYIPHPMERPQRHQAAEWVPPPGNIDFASSYKTEYTPKPAERVHMIKPNMGQRRLDAKFLGDPTYKSDYRAWQLPEKVKLAKAEYQPSSAPFEGQPTYVHDYTSHPMEMRKPFRPENATYGSNAPFEDATDYKTSYIKHAIPPREVLAKEDYIPPSVPFDALTSHQRDYQPLPISRIESMKPKQGAYSSNAPLDDVTTNKVDYVPWPLERHEPKQRAEWQRPAGEIDGTTTHKTDFKPYSVQPVERIRPPSRVRKLDAPFQGDTNYRKDYQGWQTGERPKPVIREEYHGPSAPFQGTSNYTTSYIPHPLQHQGRVGPNREAYRSDAPFDDRTNYKMEYTPKEIDICPAIGIDRNQQFRFVTEDNTGHRFYKPFGDPETPPNKNGNGSSNMVRVNSVTSGAR